MATTFREELERAGVIFRSISEAVREYPELVALFIKPQTPEVYAARRATLAAPPAPE